MMVVRPFISFLRASLTRISVSVSRLDVASSRINISRIEGEYPCEGDKLLLAEGEGAASLMQLLFVSVRKLFDEGVRVRILRRLINFLHRNSFLSEPDIALDISCKEKGILEDQPDMLAQECLFHMSYIQAVDKDAPPLNIVESPYQIDYGCLAGAGRPDDCDTLARIEVKSYSLQGGTFGIIRKPYITEFDFSFEFAG